MGACGIVSSVCSFVGGCIGAVGSFAAGAISGMAKFAGSLGAGILTGISGMAAGLVAAVGPQLAPLVGMLMVEWVGKAVAMVAQMLGITKEEEDPKELGARLSEAQKHPEWLQREDFETFQDYNEYLKEQIPELDKQDLAKNGLAYTAIGTGALIYEINGETGMELTPETTQLIARGKITAEELYMLLQTFKEEGMIGADLTAFLRHKMTLATETALRDVLLDRYMEMHPEASREEFANRLEMIMEAQQSSQQSYEKTCGSYLPEIEAAAQNKEKRDMLRANGIGEEILDRMQRADAEN